MLPINKESLLFWNRSIVWKMTLINSIVIAVVIWLVGVSVKDFACLLVDSYAFIGEERQAIFNDTMQYYLIRASMIAVIVAALIYLLLMRKVIVPLQNLAKSTRLMTQGRYPERIKVTSNDETGQLSRDFNAMIDALKDAEESRKAMLSDISHELRTPLSNLNGYLEALSSGVLQGDKELYASLHEEALHLTYLVDQLHQLAIWEAKRLTKHDLQPVAMDQLIQSAAGAFELELERKHIRYVAQTEPGMGIGNERGLRQVMSNLLSNAIQYDRGGWLEVEGEAADGEYVVKVRNQGQPIPEVKRTQLFQRFMRVDESRHRQSGGSGLGLAIALEIVQQHHGKIGLRSQEGDIHEFWFSIPLSDSMDRKEMNGEGIP
ncbi:sensor histidine kinase [Paenibacillus chungangensis]|uniref:histidine kinase n=1 Tax=Paenibacillus chungangensis TaxID=696535 RepID=A0ABW3HN27_9BACL